MTAKTEMIRALNDQLRQNLRPSDGTALITAGVAALGADAVARIFPRQPMQPSSSN